MNLLKLKQLREAVNRMNTLKAEGRPFDSLRYEIIPRMVMPEIKFLLDCAEKVMNEQKEML
jgi:hypothetical protein